MTLCVSEQLDVLGVKVSAVNPAMAAEILDDWVQNRFKTYVCVAPVSTVVDCHSEPDYKKIVNQAGMITPDGMPIVWLGKMKGNKIIERTYGPDLMLDTCRRGVEKGYKHFLYGSDPQTLEQLVKKLKETYPGIQIVGSYSPPIRGKEEKEDTQIINQINNSVADFLWIGLGSPKQDHWMVNHRERINVPVMVGVGAAFDFIAGTKPQAPVFMRKVGLEWFFRLCCEPKRLWKRYVIGNSKFVYWIIKDALIKRT